MPRGYACRYPRVVTTVERAFGAQSMTAPLRDVLVKRPGPAFGAAFDDPAHGFLHACNLAIAQREHDRFVALLASLGPTVHVLDAETDSPDLVYTFDPLLVGDRGAIALRPGKENPSASPRSSKRGRSTTGSRPKAGSRRRARSRAATRSGFDRTCCASGGRCGRTTPARGSLPGSSAATCGSSTCRTGAARPS